MLIRIAMLSLMIFQLNSAMENGDQKKIVQERQPIPEDKLELFLGKQIEYQIDSLGSYRTGTFGGKISKEKFSIVYTARKSGITVPNDKIYEPLSNESDK